MQRREFLLLAAGLGSQYAFAPFANSQQPASGIMPSFMFSAHDDRDGKHYLSRLDWGDETKLSCALPFRAHDVLPLSQTHAIAFGRRPRPQSAYVNLETSETQLIPARNGRHFYGHGCLSADQSVLFTTENDYEAAKGVIGIRDAKTFQQIGEYPSHGIGPHDMHLMPDGKTLVVANGGIQTHPDFGRRKLNLKTMQPSLVYLDSETGKKLSEYRLDDHLLSIRHLSVSTAGDVGVAAQYQGDIYRQRPTALVAWQHAGGDLQTLAAPTELLESCRGYMADLAYDPVREILAVTSPRGNQVTFWHTREMQYLYRQASPEVSGIQYMSDVGGFLTSNARGECLLLKARQQGVEIIASKAFADTAWDNHFVVGA